MPVGAAPPGDISVDGIGIIVNAVWSDRILYRNVDVKPVFLKEALAQADTIIEGGYARRFGIRIYASCPSAPVEHHGFNSKFIGQLLRQAGKSVPVPAAEFKPGLRQMRVARTAVDHPLGGGSD